MDRLRQTEFYEEVKDEQKKMTRKKEGKTYKHIEKKKDEHKDKQRET